MTMEIKVEVSYIDSSRCVVKVEGFSNKEFVGATLGEAESCEVAEDRARAKLKVLTQKAEIDENSQQVYQDINKNKSLHQFKKNIGLNNSEEKDFEKVDKNIDKSYIDKKSIDEDRNNTNPDPVDWSVELAMIEIEIKRIKWERQDECTYLQKVFGLSNRHQITKYEDLIRYLNQLKTIKEYDTPESAINSTYRKELINNGDKIIANLEWSKTDARSYLNEQLGAMNRNELSNEQLLKFNMLLEEKFINVSQNKNC